MNKKFTLLAAALMTVGTFTAASAASDVPSKEWTVGNYYYLKSGNKYLSLDGNCRMILLQCLLQELLILMII